MNIRHFAVRLIAVWLLIVSPVLLPLLWFLLLRPLPFKESIVESYRWLWHTLITGVL